MSDMAEKIQTLWPELVLVIGAFASMIVGLSPQIAARRATYAIAGVSLGLAGLLAWASPLMGLDHVPPLATFMKVSISVIGLLLLLAAVELPRDSDASGGSFESSVTLRGEFFGFFLLSVAGAMLCAAADDLIWLFLALELTSLPTYIMVAVSRPGARAPEAAVKYFFLGCLAAAVFLYGFALIYGAAGSTDMAVIKQVFAGELGDLALVGLLLAVVGICFKIAAFPMHLYAADVYQGAATPVTAFLAFIPKAAGVLALIQVLDLAGWPLDRTPNGQVLMEVLWWVTLATLFLGNTMALIQDNVKRVLAYSSIAHSGYMLVALMAGPGTSSEADSDLFIRNGIAAAVFYLVLYGLMNVGAFAVLGLLHRRGEEAETFDDLKGLAVRQPLLAAALAVCLFSLAGIPPLAGFWGKLYLFGSAISSGQNSLLVLAVLALVSSAIAAYYYLRLVAECYLVEPTGRTEVWPLAARRSSALFAAASVLVVSVLIWPLQSAATSAARDYLVRPQQQSVEKPAPADLSVR